MDWQQVPTTGNWGSLADPCRTASATAALHGVPDWLGRKSAMAVRAMLAASFSPIEQRLITGVLEALLPVLADGFTKLSCRIVHMVVLLCPWLAAGIVYNRAGRYFDDPLVGFMLGSLMVVLALPITNGGIQHQPRK
jgi:hypothetical protein